MAPQHLDIRFKGQKDTRTKKTRCKRTEALLQKEKVPNPVCCLKDSTIATCCAVLNLKGHQEPQSTSSLREITKKLPWSEGITPLYTADANPMKSSLSTCYSLTTLTQHQSRKKYNSFRGSDLSPLQVW